MKQLHFRYRMDVTFTYPVTEHSFTLRCVPYSNPFQNIRLTKKKITPSTWLSDGVDSFGNSYIYGKAKEPHDHFLVEIEGEAECSREYKEGKTLALSDSMALCSHLTKAEGALLNFAKRFRGCLDIDLSFEDKLLRLMESIYSHMVYTPGSTTIKTSANEAFEEGKGVCQDYTQIMLSVLRYYQIPCQYVAGFMMGEGESHAWVGAYDKKSKRYFEIDPTNNKWVDDDYISVIRGKDASDCIMNRGIYRGFTDELSAINVIVEEQ